MFHRGITAPTTRSSVGPLEERSSRRRSTRGSCRCSRSLVNRRSSHPCVKACYQSTSDRTVARGGHDRLLTPAGREGMKRPICAHLVCAIRIGDHQPANSRISNSPSAMKLHASSILLELLVVAPLIVSMTGLVEPDVITVGPVNFLTQPASIRP